jgi:maltose O-acetyltransferase
MILLKTFFSITFIRRIGYHFSYYLLNFVYGFKASNIGVGTNVHPTVILRHPQNIIIGQNSFINHNNVIQAGKKNAKIIIGNHVMTGPCVLMFAYNHSMDNNGVPMIEQDYTEADIVIQDDVWIGAGSILLAGVKIGKGCVIAAGSIVTSELPPYTICGGNPAKVIKNRE